MNEQLTITIPLSRWLDQVIGLKDFAIMDDEEALQIQTTDPFMLLSVVEREPRRDFHTLEIISDLGEGLYRVWRKSTYDNDNHKQSIAKAKANERELERKKTRNQEQAIRDKVVSHLKSKGLTTELVNMVLKGATLDTYKQILDNIPTP